MNNRGWVTFSGRRFRILDPREEDMCIEDVAHHLAGQGRYNGATSEFYSVAEHCVIGSYLIAPEDSYDFLMHDCAEAWVGDLIGPIKRQSDVGPIFCEMEDAIYSVAAAKFNLCDPISTAVKKMDEDMLLIEFRQLFPNHPNPEEFDHEIHKGFRLPCWSPKEAEAEFLKRYHHLSNALFALRREVRY